MKTHILSIRSLLLLAALVSLSACSIVTGETPAPPLPTGTPAAPTSTPVTRILTFFIAGGDQGKSGKPVGCGDSVVPVEWEIEPVDDPVRAALDKLFSFKDQQTVGLVGLYNALYQSDLQVESIEIDDQGLAIVRLSGTYLLGGVCDDPRFEAQIKETVAQFPQVKKVQVLINDKPLEEILSEK